LSLEEKSLNIYYDASATIPIIVENKGADVATYSLSVSGTASNFVYLNPSTIDVEQGKSEIVYLYVAPSNKVSNGDYEASIAVRLDDSTILASDDIKITVTDSPEDIPEYSPEDENSKSFFEKIIELFSNLVGGSEDVIDTPLLNITPEVIEEETPEVIEEETPEVVGELMNIGEEIDFEVGEEDHVMKIKERSGEVLLMESNSVYVQLYPGDVKKVDVNGDSAEDIELTFSGFVGDKADVSYVLLEQPELIDDSGMEDISGEVVKEPEDDGNGFFGNFFNSLKSIFVGFGGAIVSYGLQIGIFILLIAAIVAMNKTKFWEKIAKFFEEEVEEGVVSKSEETPLEVKEEKKVESLDAKEVDDLVIESFDDEKEIKESEEETKEEPAKKEVKPKIEKKAKKEKKPKKKKEEPKEEEEDEFVIEFDDD